MFCVFVFLLFVVVCSVCCLLCCVCCVFVVCLCLCVCVFVFLCRVVCFLLFLAIPLLVRRKHILFTGVLIPVHVGTSSLTLVIVGMSGFAAKRLSG